MALAVVDSGPLYAVVDSDDQDHLRSVAALQTRGLRLFVPALVVAEVTYLVGTRLGPEVEAEFLRGLDAVDVVAPSADEWARIGDLVRQYGDFPLGGTDASVVVLAERLNTDLVITLDRHHFAAVRPKHCQHFRLIPDF